VLRDAAGHVCLQRRPSSGAETGIWAGLFSPPVYASGQALHAALAALPVSVQACSEWPAQLHVLTHRDLFLHPVVVDVAGSTPQLPMPEADSWVWQSAQDWPQLGLPAPVRKLLESL